jgi:hypothetical protein
MGIRSLPADSDMHPVNSPCAKVRSNVEGARQYVWRTASKEHAVNSPSKSQPVVCYELNFQSLQLPGGGCAFPCDAEGHVDMDAMTERTRNNYLFARALVGIEYDKPRVRTL